MDTYDSLVTAEKHASDIYLAYEEMSIKLITNCPYTPVRNFMVNMVKKANKSLQFDFGTDGYALYNEQQDEENPSNRPKRICRFYTGR